MRSKKNMNKINKERVENVNFEKLRQCLKNHGIKQKELSIVCGYYPGYIEKNTLRKHYLTQHVRDVLTYAYKVDPSEYIDTQPKEVTYTADMKPKEVANTEDDDMYTLTFSGEELKRLALQSIKEHIFVGDAKETTGSKKKTSNDGQLALRLDKDLIARFRNWAFYNQLSQKDAMEKILSEYLDGKKAKGEEEN